MIRIASLAALTLLGACATAPAPAATDAAPRYSTPEEYVAGQAAYLEWNGARRGWTTTASGLQYRREGRANPSGRQPTASDTARVHYEGTFIDGRKSLMREGETFYFAIPASLGYGDRWVGGDELPPNSTLLFKVELLEVK